MNQSSGVASTGGSAARRIVVLGCAGTGKTVLARRIGERMGVPVICLDEMLRRSGIENDLPAFRALIAEAHAGEAWISDGNFAQVSFDLRLPRAELIVWIERSRLGCAWWACRRLLRRNEPHKLRNLPAVLRFIWNFDRVNRPIIEGLRLIHGGNVPVVHLETPERGRRASSRPGVRSMRESLGIKVIGSA